MRFAPMFWRAAMALGVVLVAGTVALAGAPLKGVDIKLGKNPGGGVASRVTGADGQFDFGVLPRGNYRISFTPATTLALEVTVSSAGRSQTTHFAAAATARKSGAVVAADFIDVVSDGVHALTGSIATTE